MFRHISMFLLAIAGVLVFSVCVLANDSAMHHVEGGTVQPMTTHKSIRLVSESVDIKLGQQIGYEWPVFVRCEFHLKNEGSATDVLIGFPEKASAAGDASVDARLTGFKSWVDGQQVKVDYVPSSMNEKGEDARVYKAWYTKEVHFDAGQTRRIVDVYSARLGLFESAGWPRSYLVDYILRTGASWHGTIGKAVITVDLSDVVSDYYDMEASPKGYTAKQGKLMWTFSDFEPKEDVGVELTPRLPLLNGKPIIWPSYWEPFFVRGGVLMVSSQFIIGDEFDHYSDRIEMRAGGHVLAVRANSRIAMLDGKKITLKTAPCKGKSVAYYAIPLEETVKLLGGSVKRDRSGRLNVILDQLSWADE